MNNPLGDGKCVVCDSYVRPCTLVRICDECNYGSFEVNCVATQEHVYTFVAVSMVLTISRAFDDIVS